MAKITVSAKEILADIKAGMDDTALMEKYGVSEKGLQSVFKKLVEAGVLKQEELDNRPSEHEESVEYAWKCSQCGKLQPKPFDQCPECGVIGSRIKSPLPSGQAEGIKDSEKQGEPHPSGIKAIQEALGRIYAGYPLLGKVMNALRKPSVLAIAGIAGAVLVLAILMNGAVEIEPQKISKAANSAERLDSQIEIPFSTSQLKSQLMNKAGSYFQLRDLQIVEVADGQPTPALRSKENPKQIYCACVRARIFHREDERKLFREQLLSPALLNLIIKEAQSGVITLHDPPYLSRSEGMFAPEEWDNICPFLSSKHIEEVRPVWEARLQVALDIKRAVEEGNLENLKELKSEITDMDWGGNPTPLWLACYAGNIEVVRFLLEAGADPNESVNNDYTANTSTSSPLAVTAARGDLNIAALLIDHGATDYVRTAKFAASINKHQEMEEFLEAESKKRSW